jgi:single-strand DNA-binding protein
MNQILLTGRNVKEISLKYTPSGKEVASGTIAVQRNYKNQEGKYDSDFIDFVCWGAKAKVLADYVQKGDKFGISGKLITRSYENQEGKKIKVIEVNIEDFDLPIKQKQDKPAQKKDTDPFGNAAEINDDSLPF